MDYYTSTPDDVWTDGASSWLEGTSTHNNTYYLDYEVESATPEGTTNQGITTQYHSTHSVVYDAYGTSSTGGETKTGDTAQGVIFPPSQSKDPDNSTYNSGTTSNESRHSVLGDTSSRNKWTVFTSIHDGTNEDLPPGGLTVLYTVNRRITTKAKSNQTVGTEWETTNKTRVGDWSFRVQTTVSQATIVNGEPTTTWQIANTFKEYNTSHTTQWGEDITIKNDYTLSKTDLGEHTTHAHSPRRHSVFFMQADRGSNDYNLGDQLWTCSVVDLAVDEKSIGRFTDFYDSEGGETNTVEAGLKFSYSNIAVTKITYSVSTEWITIPAEGTNPEEVVGSTTQYKNGAVWHSSNASNTVTENITYDLGPISKSGAGVFYYTSQVTGYSNNVFTTGTAQAGAIATSTTTTHLALYSANTKTEFKQSITSRTREILISKYLSYSGGSSFIGMSKTTTTQFGGEAVMVTVSEWSSKYNVEIQKFTANESSVNEDLGLTYYSKSLVEPNLNWSPLAINDGFGEVWHRGPARGHGGPVGSFVQSSMPVFQTVSVGIVGGNAFGSQTLNLGNLATALAYEHVTVYPAASVPLPDGAARASFVSTVASAGQTASIAVTWTSTTMSGGMEVVTSRFATYTVRGISSIAGTYIRKDSLIFNTYNLRGGDLSPLRGGYGLGDNALNAAHTVRLNGGYAEWTVYNSSTSIASHSISDTQGTVSFTVAHSQAIVFSVEPLITMSWGVAINHFLSSVEFFPT